MIPALRIMSLAVAAFATPAAAQVATTIGVEGASDENRRGLSWSGGRAAASADVLASRGAVDASARIVAIRGSDRHGGADAVADLSLGSGWDVGALRLRAHGQAHLFAGARGGMDYVEFGGSAGYGYGPLYLTAGASYAPAQRAIGGSNLYLHANAGAGIPGTPLTLLADLGHSSGTVDDPFRAQRLRPGGAYTDWRLGVEHRRDRLTIGLDYVGTDIARGQPPGSFAPGSFAPSPFADVRHAGDRIVGRVRLGL